MVSAGINFGVDLMEELRELKRERNAVILAHNYQVPELQDVADFVGDSLGLSYEAKKTDADVILFCGVHFMAETAKIINPSKRVILPDLDAGCSLSESCPPEKLHEFLEKNGDKNYYVIAYINCSAGVKGQADVICTGGSKYSFCAGSKSRCVGDRANGPENGFVAGELLCPRRVYRPQHQPNPA